MNAHIAKPFEIEKVKSAIVQYCRRDLEFG